MFRTILLPSVVSRCVCIAVRNIRRAGKRGPRDQAGVRIQHGIFGDLETLEEDPERTYEADFNQLGVSHREHEKEMALKKEQVKFHMIKNKYFKEQKMPNFLTWSEKEQIRELHKSEPNDWTPERLAESFPAVEEVIVKILKSKWTPANMKRVQRHDESVRKNWESFKANEIKDLDPKVVEHLKKFSNRNFDSTQNAYAQLKDDPFEFKFPEPKNKEFLHIITSCKRTDQSMQLTGNHDDKKQIEESQENSLAIEPPLKMSNKQLKKKVNYEQLMKKAGLDNATENEEMHLTVSLPEHDKSLIEIDYKPSEAFVQHASIDDNKNAVAENSHETETVDLAVAQTNTSSKIIQKYPVKQGYSKSEDLPSIRHSIDIPPKLRKKGSVYKLYDCFYDDRGKFMYRVPGLVD